MIRPVQPADIATVRDIANKAWQPIVAAREQALGPDLSRRLVGDRATYKGEEVARQCEQHPDRVLVCEKEGQVVGFVTFEIDQARGIGTICNNAADPEATVKGIGQQMYAAVLDIFRQHGLAYARVTTGLDEGHDRARRAYERAGFDLRTEHVTYYRAL